MIVFDLGCPHGHRFEAWFPSSAAFEIQKDAGEIQCPLCGGTEIAKVPMAPQVATSTRTDPVQAPAPAQSQTQDGSIGRAQHRSGHGEGADGENPGTVERPPEAAGRAQLREALGRLRRHVETNCDYVGDRFPEEARRIHYGESEARGIYGEADDSEARRLREEGIEICPLNLLPRRDG